MNLFALGQSTTTWLGGALLVGLAVAVVVYQFGRVPAPDPPAFGMRGLRRAEALASSAIWRSIEPAVRKVAAWIGLLPIASTRSRAATHLYLSGDLLGMSPDEWIASCVLAGLVGLLGGAWIVVSSDLPPVFSTAIAILAAYLPYAQVKNAGANRRREIEKNLPGTIDLIGLCVSAGLAFPQAVEDVIGRWPNPREPIVEELRLVLREVGLGHSRAVALSNFARRVPCEAVTDFVGAVVQSELKGTSLKDVLATQATLLRNRRTVMAEEIAAKAAVKMVLPMTLLLFAVVVIIGGPLFIKTMSSM